MNTEKKFPWPRALKSNEVLVIEIFDTNSRHWVLCQSHVYPKGCEHDAHGVITVTQRHDPNNRYRLKVYKRVA